MIAVHTILPTDSECVGLLIGILIGLMSSIGVVLVVGLVAGAVAVRRIRRLEPGILGRQAAWVVIGWGLGAVVAVASGFGLLRF